MNRQKKKSLSDLRLFWKEFIKFRKIKRKLALYSYNKFFLYHWIYGASTRISICLGGYMGLVQGYLYV